MCFGPCRRESQCMTTRQVSFETAGLGEVPHPPSALIWELRGNDTNLSSRTVGNLCGSFLPSSVTSLPQGFGAELSKGCRIQVPESLLLHDGDNTHATETGVDQRPLPAARWVTHSQGKNWLSPLFSSCQLRARQKAR